jgi:CxxC motif-containing protein (DUF1111 family)
MAATRRLKPVCWVVPILLIPVAWKLVEWLWPRGPKRVDPETAAAGAVLFHHEWAPNDPMARGDGLGPVFNARSCLECHFQGGAGGGGPADKNVTVYGIANPETHGLPRVGVVHRHAVEPKFQELLSQVDAGLPRAPAMELRELIDRRRSSSLPAGIVVTQRNTPALFGSGLIDAIDEDILVKHQREHSTAARLAGLNRARDPNVRGRVARLADGRLGRFGWKAEFSTLGDFVKAACANELGLSNPGRPQATPLPLARASYQQPGEDLTDAQCDLITDFLISLPRPEPIVPADPAQRQQVETGRRVFEQIGCADCHAPNLGPAEGIYSDLLLHDMGPELESSTGYYGSIIPAPTIPDGRFAADEAPVSPGEWRTPPLWGVADSAPYLHDGRAATLDEAIELHGGEAREVSRAFTEVLTSPERSALLAFLSTLRAPRLPEGSTTASRR